MEKKGSITVGLCLVLSLILSLTAVSIRSVRTAGARVQIAAGMEQGLYSVFAQYNRTLLEKYDVFLWTAAMVRMAFIRSRCTIRWRR